VNPETISLKRRIRWVVGLFIAGLLLSGATAIPIQTEVDALVHRLNPPAAAPGRPAANGPAAWLLRIQIALRETNARWPFMAYAGDWLAFGHFIIALVFVWAWREPVRNRWLFDFGLIACALVVPYALIFGALRGIPWWWRLIDCTFGLVGAVPLLLARFWARQLAEQPPPAGTVRA